MVVVLGKIGAEKHILVSAGRRRSETRGNTRGPQRGSRQGFGGRTEQAVIWSFLASPVTAGESVPRPQRGQLG